MVKKCVFCGSFESFKATYARTGAPRGLPIRTKSVLCIHMDPMHKVFHKWAAVEAPRR